MVNESGVGRFGRLEQLFHSALSLTEAERLAFLDQACAADTALRREVESLLAAQPQAADFLSVPAVEREARRRAEQLDTQTFNDNQPVALPASMIGRSINQHRIVASLGRGGMGEVWLAERADGQFDQQVAIKLLHAGSENEEVMRRFRHERQILASLDHPNIARLLDGGATEDGRPYFVMEYIEGEPIGEYCRQHQLSVDDRLRLFLQVCAAVHYAHQHLVIHRDLKPGNMVVTEDGVPKLLDFGIAKLLQPGLSQSFETLSGVTPMTPAYASPEQVRGEKLTTASDVYALGVVLYELLTGRSPYRLKSNTFGEMIRAVCDQEPERPSTAITHPDDSQQSIPITIEPAEKLRRRLAGDIDSIVLMALRKEPQARYGSVEQFSEDIRRYLAGLPTQARRGTFGYRAGKYIRRHKVPVAAATLILLSLLGGIGATLRQARIARAEQVRADQQRQRAEAALATAEERRQQADSARTEADQQRDEAEAQRNFAEEQQARAESQEMSNRRLLYASQMALANTAWNESNVERVRELLMAHIPKPGEPDLRGFEWHYLWRISHTEIATLQQSSLQNAITFSSDARQLITLTQNGTIKFWDTSTWRERNSLMGENLGEALRPAISLDKKLVASSPNRETRDAGVRVGIWEIASGKLLKSFAPDNPFPFFSRSFAFSPDGKYLAIGFYYGQILIIETGAGKEILNFQGHNNQVYSLAYSPDGTKLMSGGAGGCAKLWDARTGKELMAYNKPAVANTVAYSPDGRFFSAGLSNGSVVIWDALTIKEVKTFAFQRGLRTLVFSPDGKKIAAATDDRLIRVWETETWHELMSIKGHGNPVNALAFASDGHKLVSGSIDGIIKVWDLEKRQTPPAYCVQKEGISSDVAFTKDGGKLISGSSDQSFKIWDIATGTEVYSRRAHVIDEKQTEHLLRLFLSSEGQKLITSGDDGFGVWDINTGRELLKIPWYPSSSMALSFDGRLLAACANGTGFIQVWDTRTGNELFHFPRDFPRDYKDYSGMVFLPDDQTLVLGGSGYLYFLNLRSRQQVRKVSLDSREVTSMKLSPDGCAIAVGSVNGIVSLHDSATGREILTLKGHGSPVRALAFSPDGKRLASSSRDNTRLWDLTTGQEVFTLPPADRVAFSPDGRHLAAGWGRTVKLYSTVDVTTATAGCR